MKWGSQIITSPDWFGGFFVSAIKYIQYPLFFLTLILWSCGPQVHKPPEITETLTEPDIRVCLGEKFSQASLSFNGEYSLRSEEAIYTFDRSMGSMEIMVGNGIMTLANEKRFFQFSQATELLFSSENLSASFTWNGAEYSGNLEVHFDSDYWCAVNILPVESYLRGVVPFEIPTGQEEYREAVYAQTIAARTYSLYRIEHPSGRLFHVYSDTRDQAYNGMEKKTALADEAIEKTIGTVLLNKGEPAFAQYHSTCGGVLQDTIPLIRRDSIETQYNCSLSPLYRWVQIRTAETIFKNIAREFNVDQKTRDALLNAGLDVRISIKDRNSSGRVIAVEMKIPDQTFTPQGYRIRRILADDKGRALPSNFFFILKLPEQDDKFYIIGAGYGHGKGLCQWGALGMSLENHSYKEILNFYYPSFNLKTIYTEQKWPF